MKRRNLFKGLLALAVAPPVEPKPAAMEIGTLRVIRLGGPSTNFDPLGYRGDFKWVNTDYKTP